ncbi:amino acid ABC transporter ATP-binding protein [Actinomycetaceae bacterium TAE3-ERU4]|nr:amino acid ABC transporter ATP-binding protein [Actinomycetaceae bacterium TAE3-ERU4]
MLEVKNLRKSFGQTPVLEGVSLTLPAGQVGVLLGPSGSGKTTLMRCINLLEIPDEGEILVDGLRPQDLKDEAAWHRQVGMVFQSFNLFPHLTVLENITEAPIYAYGQEREAARARARQLLERVGLAGREDAYPEELSGGQRQRVAIARSCALDPRVICFDEPTSALDAESTRRVVSLLRSLAKEGIAILVITHDEPFARAVADKIWSLSQGKLG